jgi:hypothetical protein
MMQTAGGRGCWPLIMFWVLETAEGWLGPCRTMIPNLFQMLSRGGAQRKPSGLNKATAAEVSS